MPRNKHGLSRDIPADVKRIVRKACGFGCVICGSGIVEYEHVDPEFSEAVRHDASGIALLCPQCHSKVTTKLWSKSKVSKAMSNPACLQSGFSREFFDIGDGHPELRFGGVTLTNCPTPIQVAGMPLFSIQVPEEPGGPFRLSGFFTDSSANLSLIIRENEWIANTNNWDVEVSGGAITIREAPGKIHLRLVADPPSGLVVDRLEMRLAQHTFRANGDWLEVEFPHGGIAEWTGCAADGCAVGMAF
jgi:hypothetical protein